MQKVNLDVNVGRPWPLKAGCVVISGSHILPIEVFTGSEGDEGIGAAEHTEDANLIVVLKLETRHHYACTVKLSRQTCFDGSKPTRPISEAAQT